MKDNNLLLFFDIDDTLCREGRLNANHQQLLRQLHAKEHIKIVIATGRGTVMLPHDIRALIDEKIVDAVICTNGQYNYTGEQLISHYPMPREQARALAERCRAFGLPYQQLSENHIAWSQVMPQYDLIAKTFADVCIVDPDYYENHTIYQFSVFLSEEEEREHVEYTKAFKLLDCHFTRWQKGGADLLPNGASKARGIDDICQHFNVPLSQTMAFGDGLNDMEMLQHVGTGIAMGDAWQQLKSVADYVTGTIEEDGIGKALRHFGVL